MRYGEHQRLEIIDAFLLLVPPHNDVLLKILKDPHHPCHQPVLNSLGTSAVVPIFVLLAQLLHDSNVPTSALKIIANRLDRKFLDYLLHNIGAPVSLRVLDNLRRLNTVRWLGDGRDVLLEVDGQAQSVAIEIAKAGCVDRATYLSLLKFLLQQGQPEGRRAACDGLADFHDRYLDPLVLRTLCDPDPRVQAAAVRQLRHRGIHDGMERLVALLDHRAPEVRDAARSSLAEFNFSRFRGAFDTMDEVTREKIGRLVAKVDPTSVPRLSDLLTSPSLSTKLRALEMVLAMDVADTVLERLVLLLEDQDIGVRTDAAIVMGSCSTLEALRRLNDAEEDPNPSVREAASRSVEQIVARMASSDSVNAPLFGDFS